VLLISAFVVSPACASRLVSQPLQFLRLLAGLGPRGPLRVLGLLLWGLEPAGRALCGDCLQLLASWVP